MEKTMKEMKSDFYEPVKNTVIKAIKNIGKQYRTADVSPKDYVIMGKIQ